MLHNSSIDIASKFVSEHGVTEIDNSTEDHRQGRQPKFECHKPPEGSRQWIVMAGQTVIESMMTRVTANMVSGTRAATKRQKRLDETTAGADSQTIFSIGGMLVRALIR